MISLRLVQGGTQREALTKKFQMSKVLLLKTKLIHIVYLNQKIEIGLGLQIYLGQNDNKKNKNIKKNIFGMGLQINLGLQQQLKFFVVPLPLDLHPSPLGPC